MLRVLGTLIAQYWLTWPMWLSLYSAVHSGVLLFSNRVVASRLATYCMHENPGAEGIYLRRAWVPAYVYECRQRHFLYAAPLCLLTLSFPCISLFVGGDHHHATILLFILFAFAQRAIRFRIMIKPEYRELHMQLGNILAQITGPAFVALCASMACPVAQQGPGHQTKLFCAMLISDLKWGAAPEKYSTSVVGCSTETKLFKLCVFAVLLSTGVCSIATILYAICLWTTAISIFQTQTYPLQRDTFAL